MRPKMIFKENVVHGTTLLPIAIHHLSYPAGVENYFYLHWHVEFEFVTVLEGAVVYTIEDQEEYEVQAGEGLFIPSNQLHAARSLGGMPCEACVVVFHPNLFGDKQQSAVYSRFVHPVLKGELEFVKHLKGVEDWQKEVNRRLMEIDSLSHFPLEDIELLLRSKLLEIWHHCYRHAIPAAAVPSGNPAYKIERMQPVLSYIQAHYGEEIALKMLADLLPMSVSQFCTAFKEVMNQTPIAYVIRYRILQSCTLLMETDLKIAEIARTVGFNNISYFNREFIKAIGCSPRRYRLEG
ncbi:helix-turn-helix domain-containing protein [Paenibacillus sp. HN-1]|uniref:AraC family transcriptional regulator n=1 Tax=Paenibacillus TaxID=44249 RepID=UPI001CA9400C|nr:MULTISPECIES: AraC family transcriptional regulator [Paenibacillus]MBY9077150.1 helix-turn-helix domain-containing protein [Paenibacillus sp. CGMCC 1.18879]MBY9087397.1 helix-turn-helix domain-containing protein [Paenibacillus sinensis]